MMKRSHLKSHFICQSHISTGDETHLFGVRLFPIFGAKMFAAFYPFDNYSHSEVDIDAFKLPYHFSTLSTHHTIQCRPPRLGFWATAASSSPTRGPWVPSRRAIPSPSSAWQQEVGLELQTNHRQSFHNHGEGPY